MVSGCFIRQFSGNLFLFAATGNLLLAVVIDESEQDAQEVAPHGDTLHEAHRDLEIEIAKSDKAKDADTSKVAQAGAAAGEAAKPYAATLPTAAAASSAKDDTCYLLLKSYYNSSTVLNWSVGHYQEPLDRMFSMEDWTQLRQPLTPWQRQHATETDSDLWIFDQAVRVDSIRMLVKTASSFFDQHFPGTRWSLDAGLLIGALRGGATIPWDTDGDLVVDLANFNTEATWQKLLNLSEPNRSLNSDKCIRLAKNGRCLFVPVTEDVGLGVFPLPSDEDSIARFVDLRTGYIAEIFNEGVEVKEAQPCRYHDFLVNASLEPLAFLSATNEPGIRILGEGAIELNLADMTMSSLYTCRCPRDLEGPDPSQSPVGDSFSIGLKSACGMPPEKAWDPTLEEPDLSCCSKENSTLQSVWVKPVCRK